MKIERSTVTVASADVQGGREFIAALYNAPDGTPLDLILSVGYSDAHGWRNRAGVLALPPEALPAIREALAALDRGES